MAATVTFSKAQEARIAAIVAQAVKAALVGAQGNVASPVASPTVKSYFTKAEMANGGGFDCALGCGRKLRTMAAASSHDVKADHFHVAAAK